jgi:uncharacterized protein (DUF2252 family)
MLGNDQREITNTRFQSQEMGKSKRGQAPRSSHGDWAPAADRPDPISLLQAQDKSRLQHLVPIKYGRMMQSPFAFLRGSAVVMTSDLANTPVTDLEAVLCGDAHISNFGFFASPERQLVFDVNDFDETYPGPWEWDLKRLAASTVVAGRENGFREKECRRLAETVAGTYREAMQRLSQLSTLDMWYYYANAEAVFSSVTSKKGKKRTRKVITKARSRTQKRTLGKLTQIVDGRRRIVSDPPLLVPFRQETLDQIVGEDGSKFINPETVENAWQQYLKSLPDERRYLLQRYQIVDGALRVGGVGSVGTRCVILLLEGRDEDDAIILQLKEAGPSVLEAHLGARGYRKHAERVVVGQRLMQATSDIFLGWHTAKMTKIEFYWRQLKDMKGSIDVGALSRDGFENYIKLCTKCLARTHARTGHATAVLGYIGSNDTFASAIGKFAAAYADQTERDYQALLDAIDSGRIVAENI